MRSHDAVPNPSLQELIARKAATGLTVSVCLPALNEGPTIGRICRTIAPLVAAGLVDQLAVVDSGSNDDTREAAEHAGAAVFQVGDLLPAMDAPGKGGALWKSLGVLTGDVVIWLDSDTRNFDASFVTRLVAPFLSEPEVRMTKAFYERPLEEGSLSLRTGGARVTELVVRPLAHLVFPELTVFVQPLSGEYAAYREDLLELPFFSGYGVEVGLLIDFIARHGAGAVRQVDLGSRVHRNQDILALGRMAFQVMQVMTRRADDLGRLKLGVEWPASMMQFVPSAEGASAQSHHIEVIELPPLKSLL